MACSTRPSRSRIVAAGCSAVFSVLIIALSGCSFDPSAFESGGTDPDSPDGGEPDGGVVVDPAKARCQESLRGLAFDWEDSEAGWAHDRLPEVASISPTAWLFDSWERGTATTGPGACHGGSGCWATNLAGNYASCQRAYLESPVMDLSECSSFDVSLQFFQAHDFSAGKQSSDEWRDGGIIEFSSDGGTTWQSAVSDAYTGDVLIDAQRFSGGLPYTCFEKDNFHVQGRQGFVNKSNGWQKVRVGIPQALRTSDFRVRFVYSSSAVISSAVVSESMKKTAPGWYLDDLGIELGSAAE